MLLNKLNNATEVIEQIEIWSSQIKGSMPFHPGRFFNPSYRFTITGFNFWTRKIKFKVTYLPTGDSKNFSV